MFLRGEKDTKDKSSKLSLKDFAKKALTTLGLSLVAAGLLAASGFTTEAKTKLPTGDMKYIPTITDGGEIELPDTDSGFITPKGVSVDLVTGEHYKFLSNDEKILYEALYKAVTSKCYVEYQNLALKDNYDFLNKNNKFYLFFTGSKKFLEYYPDTNGFNLAYNRAAEACYYDHPDHVEYYMVYVNQIYTSQNTDGTFNSYLTFVAKQDDTQFATYDAQIAQKTNTIVETINYLNNDDPTYSKWPAVKEWAAHDYYCTLYDLDYDFANLALTGDASYFDYCHTAYGSLVEKSAVCDGYSTGFELIMNRLGVNTMVITGKGGKAGDLGGHAWNIVQLDGNWYEVDTTWDDNDASATHPDMAQIYYYFNRTTQDFTAGIEGAYHERTANDSYLGFKLPKARGTHWIIDYLSKTAAYAADTVVYVGAIQIEEFLELGVEETVTPKVTILPENATNPKYTLTSSEPSVVSVSGNTIKGLKTGSAMITVTSEDGLLTDVMEVSVSIKEGSEFTKSGNTYKITGENTAALVGSTKATVNVPATIKISGVTFKVTSIGDNAFKKNKKITTIKGGKNLTNIGKNAFRECKKLKNVKLADAKGLKTIGAYAFYKSGKLSVLWFNTAKLKTVGKKALSSINSKATFTITASSNKKYKAAVNKFKKAGAKKAEYKNLAECEK